jgi:hypothetical protein
MGSEVEEQQEKNVEVEKKVYHRVLDAFSGEILATSNYL